MAKANFHWLNYDMYAMVSLGFGTCIFWCHFIYANLSNLEEKFPTCTYISFHKCIRIHT